MGVIVTTSQGRRSAKGHVLRTYVLTYKVSSLRKKGKLIKEISQVLPDIKVHCKIITV